MRNQVHILTWKPERSDDSLVDKAIDELDKLVSATPGGRWVVDVSVIKLMSSENIAQLIGTVQRVRLNGGHLALAKASATVATVLRMTRLTKMLPIFDDVDQAAQDVADAKGI